MLQIKFHKQAASFLDKVPAKHARQIAERIQAIRIDPNAMPSVELKGYSPFRRFKSGEYRVIFFIADETLHIPVIGKRNDDEVYKLIERFLK